MVPGTLSQAPAVECSEQRASLHPGPFSFLLVEKRDRRSFWGCLFALQAKKDGGESQPEFLPEHSRQPFLPPDNKYIKQSLGQAGRWAWPSAQLCSYLALSNTEEAGPALDRGVEQVSFLPESGSGSRKEMVLAAVHATSSSRLTICRCQQSQTQETISLLWTAHGQSPHSPHPSPASGPPSVARTATRGRLPHAEDRSSLRLWPQVLPLCLFFFSRLILFLCLGVLSA